MARTEQPDWVRERKEYNKRALEEGWPYWRVIATLDESEGERVFGEHAPHRAAARKRVRSLADTEVVDWGRCYIPRDSWDCPNCGTHECMSTVPNLRGKWDWECNCCQYRTVGHPYEPEEEAGRGSSKW